MYLLRMRATPVHQPVAPTFIQLAGHPVRWRLLRELARSDRRVGELIALVGQPQSLVSYHLGRLRGGSLVSMRRSSADGRDSYYSLDLARCGESLAAAGGALHPGLALAPVEVALDGLERPIRILFLCTGNSARSQMAEAFARQLGGAAIEAYSAGSHPKAVRPEAVRAMHEHGIDLQGSRAKHLDEFAGQRFDYVVTLCDRVREVCPEFPGEVELIHWSIPDPAAGEDVAYEAFERTAREIETRVRFLLQLIRATTTATEEVQHA
jgi:ArsR family transcriptional regulator, arsenate/arsenite/antimonite-responsive transcriptional repressor / arsenate reductase (thioredoxin)